jgi:hypothetical protein
MSACGPPTHLEEKDGNRIDRNIRLSKIVQFGKT